MNGLQEIFNNREIAVGAWVILAAIISVFTKPVRQFLKSVLPILFCRKFIVFYIVFLFHFCLVTYFLYTVGFWSMTLLKDTIFWILFVELPLFVKAIEKANNSHFFAKLIKDNVAVAVVVEFVVNFWTFDLLIEIIIVPIALFISLLYALASQEKKYQKVQQFFNWIFIIFGLVVIINACNHLLQNPMEFFNANTLQELCLPILLLLLNLPVVYGLALYNTYEQVFIRVKGSKAENFKMKWSIIGFAGIYLSKITAIRNNLQYTTVISLTNTEMKVNLKKLKSKLSMRIGDNYMKRVRFYIVWCIIGFLISIIGIVICNSHVSLKELLTLEFTIDIPHLKEIITYICSTGLVLSFCLLICSLGFRKKKNEEISQVKKYSLHNLLYLIKRQHDMLQEYPPIDEPKELFLQYITIAYELKTECDKDIAAFENLLTSWELDVIKQLQTSVNSLVISIGIDKTKIRQYTVEQFNTYFLEKKASAPQSEKINVFVYNIRKGIEKYSEQINLCVEEFKHYL
ncbi:hypothetical protein MKC66_21105 [[Clostridium] innocuum]|nr:hypothetical protein [[Clostridium] innocuum]